VRCVRCSASNPDVARFCYACGDVLVPEARRDDYYAAFPAESVRALALVSTLMPHVSAHRHHLYRLGLTAAVAASIVAAGFGILPVALICAGVALPGMLLVYLHDHEVWSDEPIFVVGIAVLLAAAIGVGVGFLTNDFSNSGFIIGFNNALPSTGQLLEECLLLPAVVLLTLQIAPVVITARPKFSHALDALVTAAVAAVAFALAESIVIQQGAFSGVTVYETDAARDTVIALTLGFIKPVLYATVAAYVVMRFRRDAAAYQRALVIGFLLIAAYDSSIATLSTYVQRGAVLTMVIAAALAGVGLLLVRDEAHRALLGEAEQGARERVGDSVAHGGFCANCQLPLLEGAAFCLGCGTAVKAMPKQHQRLLARHGSQ
jgi:hypothetical protein